MRPVAAGLLLGAALLAGTARAARAQRPADRLARGIRAYQNLDYDSAAVLLKAALTEPGLPALADSDRVRGLAYLGATELFRSHRDSAATVFSRLLHVDPRYRIDQLVFPPDVTSLFEQVRLATRTVAVVVPPVTRLSAAGDRMVIWLYAASYHPVDVAVVRGGGGVLRTLYQGGLGDSLQVLWDGRAADGVAPDSGAYLLRVQSRGSDGAVARTVSVPLDIAVRHGDTLPLPLPLADSLFRPDSAVRGNGMRGFVTGLAGAVAVAVLPSLVAGHAGTGDRLAVAGALGAAGIVAIPLGRRPHPIPAAIAANAALRRAWAARVDSVRALNARRRAELQLVIHAGPPRVLRSP